MCNFEFKPFLGEKNSWGRKKGQEFFCKNIIHAQKTKKLSTWKFGILSTDLLTSSSL